MPVILGKSGVNREIKEIYLGNSGINRKEKELYLGKGGVNKQIYTGELFKLVDVPLDSTVYNFPSTIIPNSIEVSIYSTGSKFTSAIKSKFGATDLIINSTSGLKIILTNRTDGDAEGVIADGAEVHFYVNDIYKTALYGEYPYGGYTYSFKLVFTSTSIEYYKGNGVLSGSVTYSTLGVPSKPLLTNYKAGTGPSGYVTGHITNLIIK